jgi:hypothetical protein
LPQYPVFHAAAQDQPSAFDLPHLLAQGGDDPPQIAGHRQAIPQVEPAQEHARPRG